MEVFRKVGGTMRDNGCGWSSFGEFLPAESCPWGGFPATSRFWGTSPTDKGGDIFIRPEAPITCCDIGCRQGTRPIVPCSGPGQGDQGHDSSSVEMAKLRSSFDPPPSEQYGSLHTAPISAPASGYKRFRLEGHCQPPPDRLLKWWPPARRHRIRMNST